MNAIRIDYQGPVCNYQADYGRSEEPKPRRSRRQGATRRSHRLSSFNGIHRRRNRRWNW